MNSAQSSLPKCDGSNLQESPPRRSEQQAQTLQALTTQALELAASGLPVFACKADKTPATVNGFKDATLDPAAIKRMFSRPDAQLIGVPTGKASGRDILDLDPRHGSDEWRTQYIDQMPETLVHGTIQGGEHWVFNSAEGVRNRQDGSIAPGVDVRGEGGYAIWPPSPGYSVVHNAPIANWPDWLLPLVVKQDTPTPRPRPTTTLSTDQLVRRYRRYIETLLDNIRRAAEGTKHDSLLKNARALGGVRVTAGISEEEALDLLLEALPNTVLDWENARRTALDGLRDGENHPIELEDRPYPAVRTKGNSQANDYADFSTTPDVSDLPQANDADEKAGEETSIEPPPGKPAPASEALEWVNARYFVVNENGKVVIYSPQHDPILNRRFFIGWHSRTSKSSLPTAS
jgi:Bifunctional DNA primase/polymerase, N-terminal